MGIVLSSNGVNFPKESQVSCDLPPLPNTGGKAGMFAGVSHGKLVCMGGADFPKGYPWEGGEKKWYDDLYIFDEEHDSWRYISEGMPTAMGYGVSVSYGEKIWIVGGSNAQRHLSATWSLEYREGKIKWEQQLPLPHTLANMSGVVVGSLLIVVGGMETPTSLALHCCYALDLDEPKSGWFSLPAWPGAERIFPICGSYEGRFYMFSGENTIENLEGKRHRNILHDAYCFYPWKDGDRWTGEWKSLVDIPRGMSAGASPVPLVNGEKFRFWGGVDRVTALHTDPVTHPGIPSTVLWYYPATDSWQYDVKDSYDRGRVTLPTVLYRGHHYYISGEIKPGIRTNSIRAIR